MHFFRLLWTSIVLLIACELASAAGGESSSSGYIKKSFFGRFGKKKEKRPPTLLESIGTFDDIKDALNEEFGIVMEDIQKKFDHGVKNGWITAEGGNPTRIDALRSRDEDKFVREVVPKLGVLVELYERRRTQVPRR